VVLKENFEPYLTKETGVMTPMSIRALIFTTLTFASLMTCAPVFAGETPYQKTATITTSSEDEDFNRKIYYKNKLEFSFDMGVLPINTEFIFQSFEGENWDKTPLDYTLIPLTAAVRWHLDDIGGPWFLRGNTDIIAGLNYTVIPKGPESYYVSLMAGPRYNFVQPNWRVVPYLEARFGCGFTDAKGPKGVPYAQGQDFTFTFSVGGGLRYNFDPTYGVSLGFEYMHISNLYLSEPETPNYGINVIGPTIGVNIAF
jgi:opacity protein-like surface antigen